ncbi:LPS export ABC transporter permease LptF [Rhodanobacter sp. DHB23]|uniref:LPS export ABC transporter permease LptF n=1 Tax=Rhodanobacter sp. DHB23 TaxID=2775923 RepID=UPI0017854C8A|nr:LPS export ABC transporter permease LptF [Rhodanobacter sp. DHB23]MBD8873413.1 LPS export ABC transporter permease LptF [Rhodanobacter sp. DHB23]
MLSILDRYFLRELAQTVTATVVVLMVIVAGTAFAGVLQQVAKGSFPASVMFQVLGLRTLQQLTSMLPLACMIGVLMGLGRMYRESEMHVLMSSGMGPNGLLRPTAILAAVLVLLTSVVALWLGPWAAATSNNLVTVANRSVIAAGLDAGRFTELPGKGGIVFTDTLSQDGTRLGHSFVSTQRPTKGGPDHVKVVTSDSGELYQESNGSNRFIAFHTGWQYDIPLGADNWRRMQYERNDTALSSVTDNDDSSDLAESMPTLQLLHTETPDARAELAWRTNAPALTLVMLMLALPMSRQSPREPRYGRLMLAMATFYLYYVLLALGRAQLDKGRWHHQTAMWLLHIVMIAFAGWLWWKQYAPRKPGNGKPGGSKALPA